jgi:hypothetical protein
MTEVGPCAPLHPGARLRDEVFVASWLMTVLGRIGGLSLLLIGVLSTPGLGLTAFQRPHCASHSASTMHVVEPGGGHASHQTSAPSWAPPAHSDCSHCPATECATVAPCSISGPSAAVSRSAPFATPGAHDVGAVRISSSAYSTTQQPPTPPPQPVA